MPIATLELILRRLRILAARPGDDQSDADLLSRFSQSRDERAFEQLLVRHGPRVWGLCRQLLSDSHSAEDAFQATFMVLARRAGSIRHPDSLGSWLRGVAVRVAGKLRTSAATTPLTDGTTVSTAEAAHETAVAREFVALLHEELGRLPDRLRQPVVLCYLDGRTRDEAAKQLGWSLGTLKRRLEQGRAALHARLTRRGVNLSVAILTAGLTECGLQSAAPTTLMLATARSALTFAAGTAATSTSIMLAKSVLYSMGWSPMKWATACLLAAGTLTAGVGFYLRSAEPQPKPNLPVATAPPISAPPAVDRFGDPLPTSARARIGTMRWRAPGGLQQIAFSKDGAITIGAAHPGGVQFWDTATGQPLDRGPWLVDPALGGVDAVALSPDGSILATGTAARLRDASTVRLWDLATGKELPFPMQDAMIQELFFAPNGKHLAATMMMLNTHIVLLWEVPSGNLVAKLDHLKPNEQPGLRGSIAASIAGFSLDGNEIFTSDRIHREIVIWSTRNGERLRTISFPDGNLGLQAAMSPDRNFIATHDRGHLTVVDLATGKTIATIDTGDGQTSLSLTFGDAGKIIALRTRNGIDFYELETQKKLATADGPQLRAGGRLYAPPGSSQISLSWYGMNALPTWNARSGKRLDNFDSPVHEIGALGMSADGNPILAADLRDFLVRRWNSVTGQPLADVQIPGGEDDSGGRRAIAISPSGSLVATETRIADRRGGPGIARADKNGKIIQPPLPPVHFVVSVHDLATGKSVSKFEIPESRGRGFLGFSPNGKTIAANAADRGAQVWDVASGQPGRKFTVDSAFGQGVQFSPDGTMIAVLYANPDPIRVWNVASGELLSTISLATAGDSDARKKVNESPTCVAFAPDGHSIAVGNRGGRVQRFEIPTGKSLSVLDGPPRGLTEYLYTADGKLLITAGGDGSLWAWDVASGRLKFRSNGHRGPVTSMVLTPNGETLVTGSADTTILLWDISKW